MTQDSAVPENPVQARPAAPQGKRLVSDWRFQLAVVVLVALVPRLIYLWQIKSWPFFSCPVLDSRTQWKWASILVSGHWIGNLEVMAKAPLYAYFLGVIQWAMQEREAGLFAAHLLQLLLGAATCGLTYLLGRRVFGAAVGLVAGLLLALYSPGIYREGQLLDTALATFLAASFALLLLRAFEMPRSRQGWFATGLVLGLLGLTRPNLLLLGFTAIALMVVWERKRLGWRGLGAAVGVLALGIVLPILPITGRNYLLTGRFVPISTTGGINLYTGNNPEADGYSPIPSGIAWQRTWQEPMEHDATTTAAIDRYWRRKAHRFMREQPGAALSLLGKKLYLYWNAYEIPNNVSYEWGRTHSSLLREVPLTFAVIGPLGLLGIALGGWRRRGAWVLTLFVTTQVLAVAVFFITGRYRMPALPALCVFAAFAVVELARMAAARRGGQAALVVVGLAVLALFVNSDAYGVRRSRGANRDSHYLGQSYVMAEDYEKAKQALVMATKEHPDDADAYRYLGEVENLLGEPEEAARDLRKAVEIAPDYSTAAVKLAELHLREGWPVEEVERLLRRAVEAKVRDVEGRAMLARLSIRLGNLQQAKVDLDAAAAGLVHRSRSDTRTAGAVHAVMTAAAEAKQAGIEAPPGF
ncbi:MAG: glycosyltransferase family 39 protein [Armatimonadetes bacterium]|nr:glycosyltransferase family 39 protein [Armatimonadota bacterium]